MGLVSSSGPSSSAIAAQPARARPSPRTAQRSGAASTTAVNPGSGRPVSSSVWRADRRVSARVPAYPLYIDPPLGRCGMTEAQARASGRPVLVSKRPMARVGRAVEKGETDGFMKVVADAETRRILGAAILGIEGDDAIHGIPDRDRAGDGVRSP